MFFPTFKNESITSFQEMLSGIKSPRCLPDHCLSAEETFDTWVFKKSFMVLSSFLFANLVHIIDLSLIASLMEGRNSSSLIYIPLM